MKDRNTYNGKNSRGKFPEPGVPANDAWKQMHKMLVENNLTQPEKKDKRRWIVLWLFVFVIAIGITGYLIFSSNDNKTQISANTPTKIKVATNNNVAFHHDTIKNKIVKNDARKNIVKHNSNIIHVHNSIEEKLLYILKDSNTISSSTTNTTTVKNNNVSTIQNTITNDTTGKQIVSEDLLKHDVASNNHSTNNNTIPDTSAKNIITDSRTKSHKKITPPISNKFHFGLEWNADFSLTNNKNYFNDYKDGKQYYMWLLPSAWAKFNINKKHGLLFTFNPYQQQFAGSKTLHIEKPWIASVEPDIVTRIVKTNAINIGINYTYQINKHFNLQAGGGYSFIQNVLYKEQSVEGFSGNILSEKIYGAKKKDANFNYIKPSFLNWNIGVQYDMKKISIGAGLNQSFKNLSADSSYTVRPLNCSIFIRYRFK